MAITLSSVGLALDCVSCWQHYATVGMLLYFTSTFLFQCQASVKQTRKDPSEDITDLHDHVHVHGMSL